MSQDKLQTAINLGAQADSIMRSEVLQKVFNDLDAEFIKQWRTWPARDVVGREKLWQAVNVLGKVRDMLGKISADGRMAERTIEDAVQRMARGKNAA